MKDQILKIAGVKSEKEFYKKYPTEEAFQKAHGKEFKKAKLGAAMTPKAQDGSSESISNFMNSVGNKNCVGATWHAILGDGDGGGSGGAAAKVIPEWKEISNIENLGLDKSGRKALKAEYEAIKDKYKGLDLNTYVAAKRDAERTSRQFANPERAKYFDPSGKLLPNVDPRNIDPYLRFYREKFPTQSKLSAEDILGIYGGMEGGLSNYEKYANVGYQKPMKEGGQLKKLQQLTDFGNPPIAQDGSMIGSYMGGERDQNAKQVFYGDFYDDVINKQTGVSKEERDKQQELALKQQEIEASKSKGGGGGLGDMLGGLMGMIGGGSGGGGGDIMSMFSGGGGEGAAGLGSMMGGSGGGAISMMAKKGKKVHKAQLGLNSPAGGTLSGVSGGFDWNMGSGGIGGGQVGSVTNPYSAGPALNMGDLASGGVGTMSEQLAGSAGAVKPMSGFGKAFDAIGGIGGASNLAGSIIGGIQGLNAEKEGRKIAERDQRISELTLQASETMPEQIKRRYIRPEDQLVQPNQLYPSYGVGTNVLAKDGISIGGNPTEIQNTYNPGDIYSDLGFEPLSDSEIVKQYRAGGFVPRAQAGAIAGALGGPVNSLIGGAFDNNAGSGLGSTIGSTIGMVGGPVGSLIGGALGGLVGGALDQEGNKTKEAQRRTKQNLEKSAMTSGFRAINAQNSQFVRNGGDIPSDQAGWMSHDWNPQVITKFGDMDVSQMHSFATEGMDTLRTGGHITQNNMFPTDQYALGGELKTTWGGYAEPISHNPYMPGSGETVMFRGKSHEESDGRGHTGIGVKYGDGGHDSYTDYAEYGTENADADVEVERGEPATEMIDGQTGEKNMVVFGNLKIPNQFLGEIGDVNAKGKKFKNYVAGLGKMEAKQNKIVEKATNEINDLQVYTPFDKLKMDALQASITGANMKLKESALRKSNAAAVQNAINDTAEEHGLDADHLAKGKIKIDKEAMKQQAKYGKEILKAQKGTNYPYHPITNPEGYKDIRLSQQTRDVIAPEAQGWYKATPRYKSDFKRPWDPEGKVPKKQYEEAFKKFKEQKAKGQKPFVPYSLNKNVADVYEDALKDFNEQDKAAPSQKKATTTTQQTTAAAKTSTPVKPGTSTSSSKKKQVVTVPKKTKSQVTAGELKRTPVEATKIQVSNDIKPLPDKLTAPQMPNSIRENLEGAVKKPEGKSGVPGWMTALSTLLPYFRPSDKEGFDSSQLYPEMAALAMNQLQPVQAQLYNPDLGTPMDISLQDQLNANQSDFNALQRQLGYNPAALATLAANKYSANEKVLGEQFRLNQAEKQRVYEGNRALLNDAQLKNLGILDTQMVRQEQAKSNTRQQSLEALKSMSDKIAKNKLENRTLGIYENLYNYRFDPVTGRAINWNAPNQFDTSVSGTTARNSGQGSLPEGWEWDMVPKRKKGETYGGSASADMPDNAISLTGKNGKSVKKNHRNGNIVKAIKNL